jgi:hypothetical protein
MGENQTIVTETLDLVDDATARIPMLGGYSTTELREFMV